MTSQNNDHNVFERRVAHAGDMSRQAVRDWRAKFASPGGQPDRFTGELLERHSRLMQKSRAVFLVAITLAAYLAQLALPIEIVIVWVAMALAVCGFVERACNNFLKSEKDEKENRAWERHFQVLMGISGAMWAPLFAVHPVFGPYGDFSVVAFAAAMVLMAIILVTGNNLRFGVLFGIFPIVAVVGSRLAVDGTPASLGMAVVLTAATFFFQRLGAFIRGSHIDHLKFMGERDQFVVELEDARAISDEARRRAEESNLAKSRFLATMSHELRTPLNAILGFSEVMANEVMGPLNNDYYKEYARDIHASGDHLLQLINEILDLSRVEAGRYELNEESTSLAFSAEESHQMVKLRAAQKNIDISLQIQSDLPNIWADARAVRQVMLNLISNALKFTPTGGSVWIKVGWTTGGGQYISVKDTGPGIAEEELPVVLSSFGQGSIAIKSAEQGTGLGLPIVQALMHMHDGNFELKSKLRQGTEAIATFPRKRVLEPQSPLLQEQSEKSGPGKGLLSNRRTRERSDAPASGLAMPSQVQSSADGFEDVLTKQRRSQTLSS